MQRQRRICMSNTDTDVHLHAFTEYSKVDKEQNKNKMKDNPFKKYFFRKIVFLNVELNICWLTVAVLFIHYLVFQVQLFISKIKNLESKI